MKKLLLILLLSNFSLTGWAESALPTAAVNPSEPIKIDVYRSPSCSCCGKWLVHLREQHFQVNEILTDNVQAVKDKYGVPKTMASCHTALVNGYLIEGHVPADDIRKLLKLKPKVAGLAVPEMPAGTPGMETVGKKEPFNVMSFDKNNHSEIFSRHTEVTP